jgi:hypothetical protein
MSLTIRDKRRISYDGIRWSAIMYTMETFLHKALHDGRSIDSMTDEEALALLTLVDFDLQAALDFVQAQSQAEPGREPSK